MKRHLLLCSSIAFVVSAHAGSPNVSTTTPAAGQRGTEVEVTLSGSRLADARGLLFDEPGIEVLGVSDADIDKMLVTSPRKVLTFVAPAAAKVTD